MWANSEDPDQMPHSAASDQILRCLPMPHKKDARLIWVEVMQVKGEVLMETHTFGIKERVFIPTNILYLKTPPQSSFVCFVSGKQGQIFLGWTSTKLG